MNNTLFTASIDFTEALELYQQRHPAFYRSEKTGKIYLNIEIWVNEQENQYKQHGSIKTRQPKEHREQGKYIANLRKVDINKNNQSAPPPPPPPPSNDGWPEPLPSGGWSGNTSPQKK
jgi:hypothetical protein